MDWHSIAVDQGGLIKQSQLATTGLTRAQVETLLRRRHLVLTEHRGLYRVAGSPEGPESAAWRIVLGSNAPLSYLSAAEQWGLPVDGDGRIHVTRPDRKRFKAHRLVRVHRTLLVPNAITSRHGRPITTRKETLLDCLGWVPMAAARNLADRTFQQSWLTPADVTRRLENQAGRWDNRQLRQLLDEYRPGAEAESERRMHRLLNVAGIGGWIANLPIRVGSRTFRPDIAFLNERLILEVEGWGTHGGRERRQKDMERANLFTTVGWRVVSFTWQDIVERPAYVIATIRALLAVAA